MEKKKLRKNFQQVRGENEYRSDGQHAAHDIRLVELAFHMLTSGQLTV